LTPWEQHWRGLVGDDTLGSTAGQILADESTFKTRGNAEEKWISLEESRLDSLTLKFRIEGGTGVNHKIEIIEKELYFPKLIDNYYFILNGSRYYPIHQIIDASTYHTAKSLTLKTLLMPIVLKNNPIEFIDSEEREYKGKFYILDLFKYKVNILNYFFAHMGVSKTIEFFGYTEDQMGVVKSDEIDYTIEGYRFFNISESICLYVSDEVFNTELGIDIIGGIIDLSTPKLTIDKLDNIDYWKKRIGSIFSKNTNAQMEKADKILLSFQRILDNRTKQILRVPEKDKVDTFSIVRWMIQNYTELSKQDNMSLDNKRLRVNEYLLHPLLIKFSNNTYRLLNSKTVSFSQLKSIFNNISPGFIIKKLITNELLRYHNAVNTIDLYTSALKWSARGPQSMAEGGKSISIRYRGIHHSYIGRLGLTASSAGDPGMSGTFTPFIQTDGFYFTDENGNYPTKKEV